MLTIEATSASVKLPRDALADISPPRELSGGWRLRSCSYLGNLLRAAGVSFTVAL